MRDSHIIHTEYFILNIDDLKYLEKYRKWKNILEGCVKDI